MTTLKHHHIKFKQVPGRTALELAPFLKEMKGINRVVVEMDKCDAFVEYDLEVCKEEDIEKSMVEAGFVLDEGIMQKLKRGWIHYTEENELDALETKPHSCCDVDDIERKRERLNKEDS